VPAPDLLEVNKAISAIRTLDLKTTSIEEIMMILRPLFDGYIVHAPVFDPGLRLFRGRIYKKPVHIRELSYPPPDHTPIGRANREGCPVLYCCTMRDVPFFESRPKLGETVAIVHWETTAKLLVNHVGYGIDNFERLGSNRKHGSWFAGPRPGPADEVNRVISDFLADVFTRRVPKGSEEMYKLSIAIAEYLFTDDTLDGLIYPTVEMRGNADNFALKRRYADTNLRFLKAEYARIDAVLEFRYKITVLDFATALSPDWRFLWNAPFGYWRGYGAP
jgi:hypothetical protein